MVNKWLKSWRKRDLNKYISYYDSDFKNDKQKNLIQFKKYKKRIFSSYKNMVIKKNNLKIIIHKKYSVTLMNQDFFADKYKSLGSKILYWQQNKNKDWKIIKEIFNKKKFSSLRSSTIALR